MNGGEAFHPYLLSTPTSGAMYPPKSFYPEVHSIPSMPQPDLYPMRPYMVRPYSMNGFGGYMDMEQPAPMITVHDKTPRSRRRYPPGTQPTKHRRTRSGCYTCRQRRIKCDEARPICDRCRKGKRDCTYPGAAASSSAAARSKRKASTADDASSHADNEPEENELEHEHDNDEKADDCCTQLITPMQSFDDSAYSTQDEIATTRPAVMADIRAPLKTPTAIRRDSHHPVTPTSMHNARWNQLPDDIKMLLTYYRDNLTDHHYLLRDGHGGIIKKVLLERAVNDESQALLYAVVAFATYYYTREHGDASVVNSQPGVPPFLVPQGKSIALLQKSLRHGNPDVTTLLTILQLATMEECLGDWNNMDRHRKAALGVISRLYTPQTLALDEVGRAIAAWYMQFDLFNAMISSSEVCLGREYFLACQNFCKRQTQRRPRDPKVRFADYYTTMRLIKSDLAHYLAVRGRGAATGVDLQIMAERLVFRLEEFGRELELAFPDCPIITEKNSHMPHFNPHGILDFIEPEPYYTGDLATMNYVLVDFWALDLEIKSYVEARPATELARTTLKIAGMIERMQQSVHEPASAILSTRSALSAAGFIMPKQPQYFGWLRQQFAAIERLGYVYPSTFRRHIFDVWGVVDTDDAWLPTVSAEHVSPSEVDVQNFLAYRVSAAAAGPQPGSATSSFADVGGVLSTLPFDDEVFDLDFVSA